MLAAYKPEYQPFFIVYVHFCVCVCSFQSSGFHDFASAVSVHSFGHDDAGTLPTPPSLLPLVSTGSMDNSNGGGGPSGGGGGGGGSGGGGGNVGALLSVKMSPGGEADAKSCFTVDHQPPPKKLFSDDIPVL